MASVPAPSCLVLVCRQQRQAPASTPPKCLRPASRDYRTYASVTWTSKYSGGWSFPALSGLFWEPTFSRACPPASSNQLSPYICLSWVYSYFPKPLQREPLIEHHTRLEPLGLVGGFLDAIGGGGWGPIVVSTLMARGKSPRFSIGSVNLAEFFVALAATIIFILTIGLSFWKVIIGLAIGGALAAPLAAYVCRILPPRVLMFMVGVLIIILSIRTLYLTLA